MTTTQPDLTLPDQNEVKYVPPVTSDLNDANGSPNVTTANESNNKNSVDNKKESKKEEKSDKIKSLFKKLPRFLLGSVAFVSFFYFASNFIKDAGSIVNDKYFSFKTIRPFLSNISPKLVISAISSFAASAVSLFAYFASFKNIPFDKHILSNTWEKLSLKNYYLNSLVISGIFLQFNKVNLFSRFRPSALADSAISFVRNNLAKILPKNLREYIMSISRQSFTNFFAAASFPWIISKFGTSKKPEEVKKDEKTPENASQTVDPAASPIVDQNTEVKLADQSVDQQAFESMKQQLDIKQTELSKTQENLKNKELNFDNYKKESEFNFKQQIESVQKAKKLAEGKLAETQKNLEEAQASNSKNSLDQERLSLTNEDLKSQISALKHEIETASDAPLIAQKAAETVKEAVSMAQKLKEQELTGKLSGTITKLYQPANNTSLSQKEVSDGDKDLDASLLPDTRNFDSFLNVLEQEKSKLSSQMNELTKGKELELETIKEAHKLEVTRLESEIESLRALISTRIQDLSTRISVNKKGTIKALEESNKDLEDHHKKFENISMEDPKKEIETPNIQEIVKQVESPVIEEPVKQAQTPVLEEPAEQAEAPVIEELAEQAQTPVIEEPAEQAETAAIKQLKERVEDVTNNKISSPSSSSPRTLSNIQTQL